MNNASPKGNSRPTELLGGANESDDVLRDWCQQSESTTVFGLVGIALIPVLLSVIQWVMTWNGWGGSSQLDQLTKTVWFSWILVTIIVGRRSVRLFRALALETFRLRQQLVQLEAKIYRGGATAFEEDEAAEKIGGA
jgi:hypothetical protein